MDAFMAACAPLALTMRNPAGRHPKFPAVDSAPYLSHRLIFVRKAIDLAATDWLALHKDRAGLKQIGHEALARYKIPTSELSPSISL